MRKLLTAAAIVSMAVVRTGPVVAEGPTHRVAMRDVGFSPATIRVKVGDRVEWDNGDPVAHTATSKDGGFDVAVSPGRTGGTVTKRPGTFTYICRYHPNMTGEIVVEP